MTGTPAVPLSQPKEIGTVGHHHHRTAAEGSNPAGTASLRSLALAVLMRDRQRDSLRDSTVHAVPLSQSSRYGTVGQLPGGEMAEEWTDGFRHMCKMTPPAGFSPSRWAQIVTDADRFLAGHGPEAARLRWTTLDLFGVGREAPDHRLDLIGLAPLLGGKVVAALTEETARLRCTDGTMQTFYRQPAQAGRIPLWGVGVGHGRE